MDQCKQLLEAQIKQRQIALWNTIRQVYEIDDTLYAQVHKWIVEGTFHEHASSLRRTGTRSSQ